MECLKRDFEEEEVLPFSTKGVGEWLKMMSWGLFEELFWWIIKFIKEKDLLVHKVYTIKETALGKTTTINEIEDLFEEFHMIGTFERSLNASFIVLFPKKFGPSNIGDFWPISLVGSLYLVNVLANRLRRVMGKLVSNSQNKFVEVWQILDLV